MQELLVLTMDSELLELSSSYFSCQKLKRFPDQQALIAQLRKLMLPPLKIVLTGSGKVAHGAKKKC